MIAFDLRCSSGHIFEGWFRSSADYEQQRAGALIPCPVCGGVDVSKAVMAPHVGRKGNQRPLAAAPAADQHAVAAPANAPAAAPLMAAPSLPPDIMQAMAAIARAQAEVLPQSTWVGDAFAERARAMHEGAEATTAIHGQATRDEAEALIDDGIAIMPLLVPIVPPELQN